MQRVIFLFFIVLLSGCRHSAYWDIVCDVEDFVEQRPDSALIVLQGIEECNLTGREEKAKYSVLLSMALDKNGIDRIDFDLLQPAIDYFKRHGDATDKLRTYYYQGRIYSNRADDVSAMSAYSEAWDKGSDSDDILTKARLLSAQGIIYFDLFEMDKYIDVNLKAAKLYKEANRKGNCFNSMSRAVNGYNVVNDSLRAKLYIDSCLVLLPFANKSQKKSFYSVYLNYIVEFGGDEIKDFINNIYVREVSPEDRDMLSMAKAFLKVGDYPSALSALQQYPHSSDINAQAKYNAILAGIYEKLDNYQEALSSYKSYVAITDSIDLAAYKNSSNLMEERYNLEMSTLKERKAKEHIIFICSIASMLLISIFSFIFLRSKAKSEKYQLLYSRMENERNSLRELLDKNEVSGESLKALSERMELLNLILTASITRNRNIKEQAEGEMNAHYIDKKKFLSSTRQSFSLSHPAFIKYLEDHNLTEEEINYCCLYAIGLKGKEVGAFLNLRSHYKQSSSVRAKLGIDLHSTNLGIFLKKILKNPCAGF